MPLFDSLDKKRIAFVGNSFTFFGGCVNVERFDSYDDGYFYKLAKAFGDDTCVTNFTWGGASFWHKGNGFAERALYLKMKELHPAYYNNPEGLLLDDFYCQDLVILQQSGDSIAETYEDARCIMALFPPETKFGFYVTTYDAFHNFEPSFDAARRMRESGGVYIPLGHLVDDIINKRVNVGESEEYNKNSFIVCRKGDTFHPNTLTGYLTALCVYRAVTERDVAHADYSFVKPMDCEIFYPNGESNHEKIIASDAEMKALGALVNIYCDKYNNAYRGAE